MPELIATTNGGTNVFSGNSTGDDAGRVKKGRTLVVCFDGTSERYGSINSNVVKLFSFLAKDNPNQLVYYQAGVGTYNVGPEFVSTVARWIARTVDLGFATSLNAHVKGGYRYLQDHYQDGDRICLFGFSRGAYSARALAGMLSSVGLLPPGMTEEVNFAFEIFKAQKESASYKRDVSRPVKIEFIGVWETVSSVGGLIPRVLPFSGGNHSTKTFRHAMSLDERRAAFQPNPWQRTVDDSGENDGPHAGLIRTGLSTLLKSLAFWKWGKKNADDPSVSTVTSQPTHVKEVWFSGDHGDVGDGGVIGDQAAVSNIPLRWMIKEILEADTGIIFNDDPRLVELGIVLHPPPIVHPSPKIPTSDAAEAPITLNGDLPDRTLGIDTVIATQYTTPETTLDFVLNHKRTLTATPETLPNDLDARLELDDLPSRHLPESIPKVDLVAPIHDQLVANPGWGILEFFPFLRSKQNAEGKWINYPRINFFRGRRIPDPPAEGSPNSSSQHTDNRGVNISPDVTLFHVSVKARMKAPVKECGVRSYKSLWLKKEPYTPSAKLSGPVKFVR